MGCSSFCSNADYKEAVCDAANKFVLDCDKNDNNGPRYHYELKDKTIFCHFNASWLGYSSDCATLSAFLEKAL
jgi:hypothetical protein